MHSRALLVLLSAILTAACTFNFPLFPGPGPLQETQVSGTGKDKVLLMEISGVISSEEGDGLSPTPSMIASIKEQLGRAAKDEAVELKTFKSNRKVPVIASIMDVGASGGYYIASAADSVLAHPSSVTGSIGVIMLTMNARGLLEKVWG
jgi:protease-4